MKKCPRLRVSPLLTRTSWGLLSQLCPVSGRAAVAVWGDPPDMEKAVGGPAAALCQFLDSADRLLASSTAQACHAAPVSCFLFHKETTCAHFPLMVSGSDKWNSSALLRCRERIHVSVHTFHSGETNAGHVPPSVVMGTEVLVTRHS